MHTHATGDFILLPRSLRVIELKWNWTAGESVLINTQSISLLWRTRNTLKSLTRRRDIWKEQSHYYQSLRKWMVIEWVTRRAVIIPKRIRAGQFIASSFSVSARLNILIPIGLGICQGNDNIIGLTEEMMPRKCGGVIRWQKGSLSVNYFHCSTD